MKISRGRISLYNLLHSDEKLSAHLVETVLYSIDSLNMFLAKYQSVLIKPVFGAEEIFVSCEENQYQILSNNRLFVILNKEDLNAFLVNHLFTQKFHVIQPRELYSPFFQNPFHYNVTVHRKIPSNKWYLHPATEIYFLESIKRLSYIAAQKLGKAFPMCHTIVIEWMCDLKGRVWITDTILHLSDSKWSQYQMLQTSKTLPAYVPATELLTERSFREFLTRWNEIVIKPCIGQQGIGIIQIQQKDPFTYEIHKGNKKLTKTSLDEAYTYIQNNYLADKYYIAQQKLPLASIKECPIDVRVITQKIDSNWIVTGKLVKVAAEQFFVTNVAQQVLSLEDALPDSTLSHLKIDRLEVKIDDVCISAAGHLNQYNPEITIIGFDIGITQLGEVWIIEGNYAPDLSMFNQLS